MSNDELKLKSPRVLISYAHDSDEHRARVLALAQRLRRDGVDAWIDRFVPPPLEGWSHWMEGQLKEADRIIVVCTPTYSGRASRDAAAGVGLGVSWEWHLIRKEVYETRGEASRIVPVFFDEDGKASVPAEVWDRHRYDVGRQDGPGYNELVRDILSLAEVQPIPVGGAGISALTFLSAVSAGAKEQGRSRGDGTSFATQRGRRMTRPEDGERVTSLSTRPAGVPSRDWASGTSALIRMHDGLIDVGRVDTLGDDDFIRMQSVEPGALDTLLQYLVAREVKHCAAEDRVFILDAWAMAGARFKTLVQTFMDKVEDRELVGARWRVALPDPLSVDAIRRRAIERSIANPVAKSASDLLSLYTDQQAAVESLTRLSKTGVAHEVYWINVMPHSFVVRIGNILLTFPYSFNKVGANSTAIIGDVRTNPALKDLADELEWLAHESTGLRMNDQPPVRRVPVRSAERGPGRIKAVSIDLDGVVLPFRTEQWDDLAAAVAVADFLRELGRRQVVRVVNTGRSAHFVEGLVNTFFAGCFDAYILENGHEIRVGWDPTVPGGAHGVVPLDRFIEGFSDKIGAIQAVRSALQPFARNVEAGKSVLYTAAFEGTKDVAQAEAVLRPLEQAGTVAIHRHTLVNGVKFDVGLGGASKGAALRRLLSSEHDSVRADLAATLHIGDGANDVPAWDIVGWRGIVLPHSSKRVAFEADIERLFPDGSVASKKTAEGISPIVGLYHLLHEFFGLKQSR